MSSPDRRKPFTRLMRRTARWVEHFFAALGVLFLTYHLFFDLSVVVSRSMSPTLLGTSAENGDWVLTEKLSFGFRKPRRWEVVTFETEDGLQVMKRVAGLPGESVTLAAGELRVNGEALLRPASIRKLEYLAYGRVRNGRAVECGSGYFVLGDHSTDSADSRFEGPVEPRRIIGRAWLVVWPPSRIGFVSP